MIYPMFAMVLLTFLVFFYGIAMRVRSVKTKQVPAEYYKIFRSSQEIPERIIQHKNHVDNLFQIPVLFYAGCIMATVSGELTTSMVICAWAFVFLRIGHTIVHLTYNKVLHRLAFFIPSNVCVLLLWIQLVLR